MSRLGRRRKRNGYRACESTWLEQEDDPWEQSLWWSMGTGLVMELLAGAERWSIGMMEFWLEQKGDAEFVSRLVKEDPRKELVKGLAGKMQTELVSTWLEQEDDPRVPSWSEGTRLVSQLWQGSPWVAEAGRWSTGTELVSQLVGAGRWSTGTALVSRLDMLELDWFGPLQQPDQ